MYNLTLYFKKIINNEQASLTGNYCLICLFTIPVSSVRSKGLRR